MERDADFNYAATQSLLSHVADKWEDVDAYYNNSCFNGETLPGTSFPADLSQAANPLRWMTLYDFMHDEVAKAAMGDVVGMAMVAGKVLNFNYFFGPIALFFVGGSGQLIFESYVFDTHEAFTYYTAVKLGLFN